MGIWKRKKDDYDVDKILEHNHNEENKITGDEIFLEELRRIETICSDDEKAIIEKKVKIKEKGIKGEKSLYYKFNRFSPIPYVLQDVILNQQDLENQIDFMVFTPKVCFVIECKNWSCNLSIDEQGHFFIYTPHKKKVESPVEQNKDHMGVIERVHEKFLQNEFKINSKIGIEDYYKPIVVLANNEQNVTDKYAPREIKEVLLYAEELTSYIKKIYDESSIKPQRIENIEKWMRVFENISKENEKECYKKNCEKAREWANSTFNRKVLENKEEEKKQVTRLVKNSNLEKTEKIIQNNQKIIGEKLIGTDKFDVIKDEFRKTDVYKAVAEWRLEQSYKEHVKAHKILTNREIFTLVVLNIDNINAMYKIREIQHYKVVRYGHKVINILNEHRGEVQKISDKYIELLVE